MYAIPNCRVDIIGATQEDSDGDTLSSTDGSATPRVSSEPFSILERSRRVFSPASLEPRTIRSVVGRCNGNVEVYEDDVLHDVTHDRWYSIISISEVDSAVTPADLNIALQRTSAR